MARSAPKQLKFAKPKKLTYSKAKKEAWIVFSQYIRLRDCLKTTEKPDEGRCFTCDNKYPFKKLQAGHFIAGRHNAIVFDERGVHAQCMMCNVFLAGNTVKYFRKMQQIYGEIVIKELEDLDKTEKTYKVYELVEIKEQTQAKIDNLKKVYNI